MDESAAWIRVPRMPLPSPSTRRGPWRRLFSRSGGMSNISIVGAYNSKFGSLIQKNRETGRSRT